MIPFNSPNSLEKKELNPRQRHNHFSLLHWSIPLLTQNYFLLMTNKNKKNVSFQLPDTWKFLNPTINHSLFYSTRKKFQ